MLKSESLSLVPNLTFWFNDLILGRSRSSVEYYLSPLQKVLKGLRVILHCIGIKSISSHLRCPGSGRVGVRSRVGTIFFVFPKYKLRTPSKPGRQGAPSWFKQATSSYFAPGRNNSGWRESLWEDSVGS